MEETFGDFLKGCGMGGVTSVAVPVASVLAGTAIDAVTGGNLCKEMGGIVAGLSVAAGPCLGALATGTNKKAGMGMLLVSGPVLALALQFSMAQLNSDAKSPPAGPASVSIPASPAPAPRAHG